MSLVHDTIKFRRTFPVPASVLFEAYADPVQRQSWTPPSPSESMVIDFSEFRTGGFEEGRSGAKDNLSWKTKVKYHLVEKDRLIVFTEELWQGEKLLTVALISFEIEPNKSGCLLVLTDQVTSWVGQDGVDGHRVGYEAALQNLATFLKMEVSK